MLIKRMIFVLIIANLPPHLNACEPITDLIKLQSRIAQAAAAAEQEPANNTVAANAFKTSKIVEEGQSLADASKDAKKISDESSAAKSKAHVTGKKRKKYSRRPVQPFGSTRTMAQLCAAKAKSMLHTTQQEEDTNAELEKTKSIACAAPVTIARMSDDSAPKKTAEADEVQESTSKKGRCSICQKDFGDLLRHAITHTPLKPYECPHCNHRCNRDQNMKSHVEVVHKKKYNEKNVDLKKIIDQYYKSKAAKTVQNESDENEELSEQSQSKKLKLNSSAAQSQAIICEHCGKTFKTRSGLGGHVFNTHRTSSQDDVDARATEETDAPTSGAGDEDATVAHGESPAQQIPCTEDDCTRTFKREQDLKRHLNSHKKKWTYEPQEDEDGQDVSQEEALPKSRAAATAATLALKESARKVPCTIFGCEKTFKTKGFLKKHLRQMHSLNETADDTAASGSALEQEQVDAKAQKEDADDSDDEKPLALKKSIKSSHLTTQEEIRALERRIQLLIQLKKAEDTAREATVKAEKLKAMLDRN